MGTIEDLRRDVILYVTGFVEERLANDPNRLQTFRTSAQHFRNCHPTQRLEMVRHMFGAHNQDLTEVYYQVVQEQYDQVLRQASPHVQMVRLLNIARICYCVQFMDLYRRQGFPVSAEAYRISCQGVELFIADRIPEAQLLLYFGEVFLLFPSFRSQLEARLNRLTSLFRGGTGI